jgi:RHS repeat-associated protein
MYQKTAFTYDAKGRLRIRQEYSWVNSMWSLTETINYMYDGMIVIQMRGSTTSSYTRGLDQSLSQEGAGGIGGLLAQTVSGAHSYYHSDGNGNVTYLMRADQTLGISYRYDDAYGNVVTMSGTLSNPFRFSSKEWLPRISAYYFGYRFYYPSLQRWLNRDPLPDQMMRLGDERFRRVIAEFWVGSNPYVAMDNKPTNIRGIDTDGRLSIWGAGLIIWRFGCGIYGMSAATQTFPDPNDGARHCTAVCKATQCAGWLPPLDYLAIGVLAEIPPLIFGPDRSDSIDDILANIYGAYSAYTGDCEKKCVKCGSSY